MELTHAQRTLLARMALVSYGNVQRFGGGRGGESGRVGPPGESLPMADVWAARFMAARGPEDALALTEAAQAEFDTYRRRALAPDTTETWEELAGRIVSDGWGISADECAMAMRCTPTMVRRARLGEMRHPDTGYSLPAASDAGSWAIMLDKAGLSLREIAAITGVSKSSVHRKTRLRA